MKHYLILGILFFAVSCATQKANRPNEYIYWVNSAKVPCKDGSARNCFKVQKGDTLNYENWQYFYSYIDGFDYKPGYIYKLVVREDTIAKEKVPADASSIKFTLVKVIEKQKDMRLRINDIWIVQSINGEGIQIYDSNSRNRIPQIEFRIADMRVIGNDGCNNFFGSIKNIEADKLILGQIAGTKMACIGTDIPDKFNAALNQVAKYKIENLQLILSNNLGTKLITLKKVD